VSAQEANLKLAAGLARDRATRVTLIVPRSPGLLTAARKAATAAGVEFIAERVGGSSVTLKFVAPQAEVPETQPARAGAWAWLASWLRAPA
jgi:hypothetical protein